MPGRGDKDTVGRVSVNGSGQAGAGDGDCWRERLKPNAWQRQCGFYPFAYIPIQRQPPFADQHGDFPRRDG